MAPARCRFPRTRLIVPLQSKLRRNDVFDKRLGVNVTSVERIHKQKRDKVERLVIVKFYDLNEKDDIVKILSKT